MNAVRFFVVALVGLAVDFAAALALHRLAGVALPLAAACGFTIAALGNYLLHETWTFPGDRGGLSAGRGAAYFGAVLAALGVRVAAVFLGARWIGEDGWRAPAVLLVASGASFGVNYALSRKIFRTAEGAA